MLACLTAETVSGNNNALRMTLKLHQRRVDYYYIIVQITKYVEKHDSS